MVEGHVPVTGVGVQVPPPTLRSPVEMAVDLHKQQSRQILLLLCNRFESA